MPLTSRYRYTLCCTRSHFICFISPAGCFSAPGPAAARMFVYPTHPLPFLLHTNHAAVPHRLPRDLRFALRWLPFGVVAFIADVAALPLRLNTLRFARARCTGVTYRSSATPTPSRTFCAVTSRHTVQLYRGCPALRSHAVLRYCAFTLWIRDRPHNARVVTVRIALDWFTHTRHRLCSVAFCA